MLEKNIVTDKIKVFVSSRCGIPKYDEVRKSLKENIEQTGIASVYLFEEGLASTQSAEQNYLYALDDSDVCIFIIDNADGVTPAIVNEIKRAKSKSKKSIYLFCNEREKKPTQIQNELSGAKGARYYVVESFTQFLVKGYESLINDICEIYKHYCKNRLIDQEFSEYGKTKIEIDSQVNESIKKNLLKGLDKTKQFINRQIYDTNREIKDTNEFDDFCNDFLHVIFGIRSIREFNTSLLLEYLKKEQSETLHTIVRIRWKAIQSYWQGNLTHCQEYLEIALSKAKEYSIPHWMIQDILIDLRNISSRNEEVRNQYQHPNIAQKELDMIEEALYYPLLDRYTNGLYEEIDKQKIKFKTQSPNSVSFGNEIIFLADNIANILAVAIFNGSLTHILLTLDRIKSVAFHLTEKYSDWEFRISLLKLTIYKGNKKEIESYINTFNDVFGKMNAKDALEIYNFSKSNPIQHLQSIATLEAFKHLGYFFLDKDYDEIQQELLLMINEWVENKESIISVGNHIFATLKNNHRRLDNNIIAQICIDIITNRMYRYYDDVFDLLAYIGFKKVNSDLSAKIILEINKIIIDEKEYTKYHDLISLIIVIRKTAKETNSDILHENVMRYLPETDKNTYKLEVLSNPHDYKTEYIPRYVDEINRRNNTQGKNGTYSGYGSNPYKIISNIIKYGKVDLSEELIETILAAATDTLLSKSQLISDKVSAMQLMVFVINGLYKIPSSIDLYTEIANHEVVILNGHDGFFDRYSTTTLKINYLMLQLALKNADYKFIFEVLSEYNKIDDFENIQAMKAVMNLFENEFCNSLGTNELLIILQFVLSMCNGENHSIRYYSAKSLLHMITVDTEKPILTRLSQFMDFDSSFIKNLIMQDFDRLMAINPDITSLMIQKASIDNHYVVRKKGKEYLEKYLSSGVGKGIKKTLVVGLQ